MGGEALRPPERTEDWGGVAPGDGRLVAELHAAASTGGTRGRAEGPPGGRDSFFLPLGFYECIGLYLNFLM